MNDFKVGDRVQYTGNVSEAMVGKVGVVVQPPHPGASMVFFNHGDDEPYGAYPESLTKLPAPDVITINRADLPEVTESDGSLHCGESHYFTDPEFGAAKHRQLALQQLAVAEFIEARDKAAEEAIHKRDERRADLDCLSRHALIECIIDLEASHD